MGVEIMVLAGIATLFLFQSLQSMVQYLAAPEVLQAIGLAVPRDLAAGAEAALARFGLAALQDRSLDAVSGGQRQLVFLAQAIFRAPRALLLDEPTASLDLRHQLLVLEDEGAGSTPAQGPTPSG